jgi:hypothetical protein
MWQSGRENLFSAIHGHMYMTFMIISNIHRLEQTIPHVSFHLAKNGSHSLFPPLLPPITPTSTIDTTLRLLTNILATKLALDLLLDNIIIRAARVRKRNDPERQRNTQEPHNLVQKAAVRKHYGPVV